MEAPRQRYGFIKQRPMDVAGVLYVAGMFTISFDVFLVLNIGPNIRIAQLFFIIPMMLGLLRAVVVKVKWPIGFSSLLLWMIFIFAFVPNSGYIPKGVGYAGWLAFNIIFLFTTVQMFSTEEKLLALIRWYIHSFAFVGSFALMQFALGISGLGAPLITQWWIPGALPRINAFSYEPSFFVTYLIFGWVFVLYLRCLKVPILPFRLLTFYAVILTAALIVSGSRLGLLMMLLWYAQFPVLFIGGLLRGKISVRNLVHSLIFVSFPVGLFILVSYAANTDISRSFGSRTAGGCSGDVSNIPR
jgi:hypothetical protein